MNLMNQMMSYDKNKNVIQERCECKECTNSKVETQIIEYPLLTEEEIEQIINERYLYKDEKTKNFIRKALRKHGDRYDYSNVVYVKAKIDVEIICRVGSHKPFPQTPDKHLSGHGCLTCRYIKSSEKLRMTKEEFIEKAREVHGDKYDYSKVEYVNYDTKVIIICNNHNEPYEFKQTPSNHLLSKGCKLCGIKKRVNKRRKTKDEFIREAREVHGNKYDYSKVNYKGIEKNITIICPKHGEFPQTPLNHLNNKGCKLCGIENAHEKQKLTTEEFIKRAKEIHGDKYDYSKVEYINMNTDIIIICPKHNDFKQTPNNHLNGEGCSKCKISKGENKVRKFLIKNKIEFEEQKRFNNCKDKRSLPFDFYLPQHNLCIEFDGEQHFKPFAFNSKMTEEQKIKNLESCKKRDKIKTDYCKNNNINLLRIRYDENVEEKLNEYFQNYNIIKEQTIFNLAS